MRGEAQYVQQRLAPGIHEHPATSVGGARAESTASAGVISARAFTALLGWAPGAYAGGYIAYNAFPRRPCGCDDPGLDQTLRGIVIGGAAGAGLGAALPGLESHCSFLQRFGLSLLGSAAGSGLAMTVRGGGRLVAVPLLSISGAALAELGC